VQLVIRYDLRRGCSSSLLAGTLHVMWVSRCCTVC
jgi:hypothetical protein